VLPRARPYRGTRAFHAAALASAGQDDGAPSLRALYHPAYFSVFILDPDRHRIEAVCHAPFPSII
jgi:hypothetical protein